MSGGTARIVPLIFGLVFGVQGVTYGQFTPDVNLVEVYATVTDRQDEPVAGLTVSDFRVSEDARRRR